jgi:hypothetical protein
MRIFSIVSSHEVNALRFLKSYCKEELNQSRVIKHIIEEEISIGISNVMHYKGHQVPGNAEGED